MLASIVFACRIAKIGVKIVSRSLFTKQGTKLVVVSLLQER